MTIKGSKSLGLIQYSCLVVLYYFSEKKKKKRKKTHGICSLAEMTITAHVLQDTCNPREDKEVQIMHGWTGHQQI